MKHSFYGHGEYYNIPLYVIVIGIVILLLLIVFIIYKIIKKDKNTSLPENHINSDEIEAQIFSMLNQYGHGMTQMQIRNALNLPLDVVSKILFELEKEGQIKREWSINDYTFIVKRDY
jgi:uncharacterized membrane protein